MSYSVTPTLSVEAVQERLIEDAETLVAVRLVGAVGAVVSAALPTVTVAEPLALPPAPVQDTE